MGVMPGLVVIETWEGLRAPSYGLCGACGWDGWDLYDIGLVQLPDGAYEHDDPVDDAECPNCGLHELRVALQGDPVDERAGGLGFKRTKDT